MRSSGRGTTVLRRLITSTTFVALLAGLAVVVSAPAATAAPREIALILDYRVVATCAVYPNYPKEGVIGNQIGWTITPSDIVGWRYNINNTWAMVSDAKYRNTSHPWWGITKRSCIGGSVGGEPFPTPESSYPAGVAIPNRILEGRSAIEEDHYRTVDFSPDPAGNVINDYKAITSMGTLRDGRGAFVIGNVFAGWHVHQTDLKDGPWTFVYVPNAKRWGWVMDIHL